MHIFVLFQLKVYIKKKNRIKEYKQPASIMNIPQSNTVIFN